MRKFLKILLHLIWTLVLLLGFLWCGLGFFYQLDSIVFSIIGLIWLILTGFVLYSEWQWKPRAARAIAIIAFIGFGIWWSTIKPTLDGDWDPALQYGVTANLTGSTVHVSHIRNFDWQTPEQGIPRWFDASFDLTHLKSMNIYLSYWMGPYIAHTLVGFEFDNGQELIFSSEIRRKKGQEFSAIGGFFKEFELITIAATKEDIIRLRTDIRKEQVYRYPLKTSSAQTQALFLTYIEKANALSKTPRFYNTATANCTTVVFDMARILEPSIPKDWRILFSGQLPSYLYDHGFIDTSKSLEQVVKEAHLAPENP
ncbi:DUF4105 domain-containing protein [Bartonella sp. HY329]|uniref:Lnb N-terminal periplasmic domain-containing protein n=1 Tax=unclassified Bartonella TaxID=2645622 RepID=UPI0021C96A24|nr:MULTISPECIES: DUF4105 domain-containing protein [unclassified Bartonella]UXM94568.1 DUF4105 domain-containing protein [Bartonella sp. HY329]UXN08892.1 DUF4105 domain-containing protein [Bartonella sp. HY328]